MPPGPPPEKLYLGAEEVFSLQEEIHSLMLRCDSLLEGHYGHEKRLESNAFLKVLEIYNTSSALQSYIDDLASYLDLPENKSLEKVEILPAELQIMSTLLVALEQLKSQLLQNNITTVLQ